MRTSYAEYAQARRLATYIVENNLDIDYICEGILDMAQNGQLNEETLLEFWGGVPQMARGLQRAYGMLKRPVADAAGLAGQGLQAAGQGIANKASAMKQNVQGGLAAAGNYLAQGGEQQVQQYAVKQVRDRLQALYGDLAGMGMDQNQVKQILAPLEQAIQAKSQGAGGAESGSAGGAASSAAAG